MKPVNFKPDGRKILETTWRSSTAAHDPDTRKTVGPPTIPIVFRLVEKDLTINGHVEGTTVYAEGPSLAAVKADCEHQLEGLYATVWVEKLWVTMRPDDLFGSAGGLAVKRVRLAETPHGPVWQLWHAARVGRPATSAGWHETRLGAPLTGDTTVTARDGDHLGRTIGLLFDPDTTIEAGVAALQAEIRATLERAARMLQLPFCVGHYGVLQLIGDPAFRVADAFSSQPQKG